jgi:hypothetical protein
MQQDDRLAALAIDIGGEAIAGNACEARRPWRGSHGT